MHREVASTYYRPFQSAINTAAGGKLYEQYVSYRKILASRGVIQLRERKRSSAPPMIMDLDAHTTDSAAIAIVKQNVNLEDDELVNAWEALFEYRNNWI